jgi:hypothetical protein
LSWDRRSFLLATGLSATAIPLVPAGSASADTGISPEDQEFLLKQARDYLALRSDQLTNAPSLFTTLSGGLVADTDLEARIHDDIAVIGNTRELHRSVDGGNNTADVAVSLIEVRAEGDRLVATVEENTRLYYENPEPDEPECEEYWLRHDFTFRQEVSGWVMLESMPEFSAGVLLPSTQVIDPGPDSPEPEVAREAEAPLAIEGAERSGEAGTLAVSKKNKQKIVDYAQKHVKNYNKEYRAYEKDCTNFVSQALKAGGWSYTGSGAGSRKDNKKWFYGSTVRKTSFSWAAAENWGIFARDNSKRTESIAQKSLVPGDVVQAAWQKGGRKNHTMIVVKTGKNSEKYLNYHSNDTKEKKLSRIKKENPNAKFYTHRT